MVPVLVPLVLGYASSALAQSTPPRTDIVEKWFGSGHADMTSPAFTHWDDEGEIPPNCAKCHAGSGFRAFYGFDGSTQGVVEHPIASGGNVDCETCHNDATSTIEFVPFPSEISVANFGSSTTCITCHQGRQSTIGINKALAELAADKVNSELTFINSHYKVAAASLFGTETKGGYEYEGKAYRGRFTHVPERAQCTDCHDPHSLDVEVNACVACHKTDAPRSIRMSPVDFNGDGDIISGIADEILDMHRILGDTIMAYADQITETPLVYEAHSYPYFFVDLNANGTADAQETIFPNQFKSWTPRLLKAAYNYQFVAKDTGAYVHNPHYAVQLLFDSLESLSEKVDVTLPDMKRP